jgi:hypothetical protein
MANTITLTGNDTTVLNGSPITDFGDGDVVKLTFPNNISEMRVGKDSNVISSFNAQGELMECELRVIRGTQTDILLSANEAAYIADPPSFQTYSGTFTKRLGDGSGDVASDTYIASFGVPKKFPAMTENTSGDTEQAIAVHMITFGQAARAIL